MMRMPEPARRCRSAAALGDGSTAEIALPDPVTYRRDWRNTGSASPSARPPARSKTREIAAPEPPPG